MTQRKGEIIIPKVDFERARITTRRAPGPKIGAGLDGWIEWQLIDRNGQVVRGGEQHNLFLDQGLNQFAASRVQYTSSANMIVAMRVGTGSAAPDVSDVALDAQVARTTTTVSGTSAGQRIGDGIYRFSRQMQFDFNEGNGNLAEFGVDILGSVLAVRELFRDSGGTPIVITKTSDYVLRITYTLDFTLTPVTPQAASFIIDGVGLIRGSTMWVGGTGAQDEHRGVDLDTFGAVAAGVTGGTGGNSAYGGYPAVLDSPITAYNSSVSYSAGGVASGVSHSPFTPGLWQRSVSGVFGVAQGNFLHAAYGVVRYYQFNGHKYVGFVFNVDEEDRFTKDNEHTLTIDDVLTVTWGRA